MKTPPSVQDREGPGCEPPAPTHETLRRLRPLDFMQPEELGITPHPRPLYVLRTLCRFALTRPDCVDIVNPGGQLADHDLARAYHLIANGLCEPIDWQPDAEAVRRLAIEALGVLVPGEPETADKLSAATKAQIRRVVALIRGKEA